MAVGSTLIERLGRSVSRVGNLGTSRKGLFAIGAMAGVAGFSSVVGPATRDAVLEVGLGDKDADRYFTGSKFSGRSLLGAGIGGNLGNAIQMTSPGDYMKTHMIMPSPVASGAGGSAIMGAGGALVGGLIGAKKGKGIRGGIIGGIAGAMVGGIAGAAAPLTGARSYMSNNSEFFAQSPYAPRSSRNMMNDLGAAGDIVLGMHNSRRGY